MANAQSSSTTPPPDDPDDPVIASYAVLVRRPLPPTRRLLVLQQPNKHAAAVPHGHALPFRELRLKPRAGVVEADLPIDTADQYDRAKGVAWGAALLRSTAARNGGSHGLPGGFSAAARPARGAGAAGASAGAGGAAAAHSDAEDGAMAEDSLAWADALRQGKVLRTRTLGGQAPELTDCQVMVGVFQGDTLHLTPVSSHVHLRTQLHHLDAVAEQERLQRPTAAGGLPPSGAAQESSGGPGKQGGASSSARAIHMTIKSASGADGDTLVLETMADRLRGVQREPWTRMDYVDENTDDAWDVYAENLLVRPRDPDAAADERQGASGGAGGQADLKDQVPHLQAKWEDEELLRAVSGMAGRDGDEKPKEEAPEAVQAKPEKGRGKKEVTIKVEDEPPKRGRPGRPLRSKAAAKGASASTAMELD